MKLFLILTIATFILIGCKQKTSKWTTEPISKKSINWNGSYDNYKKLKLVYHGYKIYFEKDKNSWAFKSILKYPKNNQDDTFLIRESLGKTWMSRANLIIPINKIIYELYDTDDFIIDSITLEDCGSVIYNDSLVIQHKKSITKDLLEKIKYGKINIQAGYAQSDGNKLMIK